MTTGYTGSSICPTAWQLVTFSQTKSTFTISSILVVSDSFDVNETFQFCGARMTTNIDNRGPISNQAANQYIKNAYLLVHMNDESVEFN
jgi:hypothetical protein